MECGSTQYKSLGFVHQTFNLLSTLTVKENIILPLTLDGVHPQDMNNEVLTIAEKLGILNILNKYIYEISGSQAQRVAIARAAIFVIFTKKLCNLLISLVKSTQ